MTGSKKYVSNKRFAIKAMLLAGTVPVWQKPVINSVILPAHAVTSGNVDSISASSLDTDNPFSRFLLIVDSSDRVLSNCGPSGGTASAQNLSGGTYRVFADSNEAQNHVVNVNAGGNTKRISVPTNTGTCNYLVATVNLPSGVIIPAAGEQISGDWNCMSSQGVGCS